MAPFPLGDHDAPHFQHNAKDFLGLTPRRLLAMPVPYLRAVLRARAMVISRLFLIEGPLASDIASRRQSRSGVTVIAVSIGVRPARGQNPTFGTRCGAYGNGEKWR